MDTTTPSKPVLIANRYRVIRALGRGGMGDVYEAENVRTKRRVAVKTMRPEVAARAEYARRFEREAQAAGQLRHPNIVDVLDLGDDPELGLVFIVQEFLSGGDLRKCLKTMRALPLHNTLATLLPVADALATAHAAGIVHRDLKPDNIFLHETPHGVVPKLIDFGIAKFTGGGADASRTATGALLGSPNYMSPEQARGDSALDGRTDVWSLGVVFYEALSGRLPYDAPTTNVLLAKIIFEEPIAIAALVPSLPADVAAVIQRAVTKDLRARWPSMRAFADALASCALWRSIDPAHAPRWIVSADGLSHDPRASVVPPAAMVDPGADTWRAPSGETSAQRSGLWHGEVSAAAPPPNRLRFAVVGAVLVTSMLVGLAAFVMGSAQPPRASRLPTVAAVRPAAAPSPQPPDAPRVQPAIERALPPAQVSAAAPSVVVPVEAPPAVVPVEAPPAVIARRPQRQTSPRQRPTVVRPPPGRPRRVAGTNGALIMED